MVDSSKVHLHGRVSSLLRCLPRSGRFVPAAHVQEGRPQRDGLQRQQRPAHHGHQGQNGKH